MQNIVIVFIQFSNAFITYELVLSVQAMLKEIKDQKPVLDQLNELSSSLLDLIPWHTRESLDKLVSEDNERYRAAYDTLTQKVDQINADILKSQQVNHIT